MFEQLQVPKNTNKQEIKYEIKQDVKTFVYNQNIESCNLGSTFYVSSNYEPINSKAVHDCSTLIYCTITLDTDFNNHNIFINTNNEYKSNRDYYKHKYPLRQNRQLMTGGYKKIYEINKYNFTKLKYIL